jgi:DNA-binding transcriptional regulator YhcF (GntR family)
MKRTTSLIAFEKILKELSPRQMKVYEKVSTFPGITERECAFKMKVPVHTISGRFTELERKGVIKEGKEYKYFKGENRPHTKWELAKRK